MVMGANIDEFRIKAGLTVGLRGELGRRVAVTRCEPGSVAVRGRDDVVDSLAGS